MTTAANFFAAPAADFADFDFLACIDNELTPAELAQIAAQTAAEAKAKKVAAVAYKLANPYKVCGRCSGDGNIPAYHYNASGVCFQCCGTGKVLR